MTASNQKYPATKLAALRSGDILEVESEEGFDDITPLAPSLPDVPNVLIGLVDDRRNGVNLRVGSAAADTAYDLGSCGQVFPQQGLLEVKDAALNARLADNPLIIGEPHIRCCANLPFDLRCVARSGGTILLEGEPDNGPRISLALLKPMRSAWKRSRRMKPARKTSGSAKTSPSEPT